MGFSKDSKEPFVIFAGRQTSDGDTAHVPSQVAESLGIPQATFVERIEPNDDGNTITARRIIKGGYQILKLPMPCVISFTPTGIKPQGPERPAARQRRVLPLGIQRADRRGVGEGALVAALHRQRLPAHVRRPMSPFPPEWPWALWPRLEGFRRPLLRALCAFPPRGSRGRGPGGAPVGGAPTAPGRSKGLSAVVPGAVRTGR